MLRIRCENFERQALHKVVAKFQRRLRERKNICKRMRISQKIAIVGVVLTYQKRFVRTDVKERLG